MLQITQLSKSYRGGAIALRDISFTIKPHSFTAILGPSGAGKSTLLRCIPRLLQPDQGQIWFQGLNLTTCSTKELRFCRRQIALVAQQSNLVRRRSALANCLAGRLPELSLWRCFLNQYPTSLLVEGLSALNRVQLLDFAFQRADQLSGGQQQRVAIARALTQGASLILADEPVASLDPNSAQVVLSLLRSLCQQEGLTVICNLHQVEFAKQYSDRILGIRAGRLVLNTPTDQLDEADINQIYRPSSLEKD